LEILSLPHSRIEFAGSEMVEVSLECAIVGRPGTFDVTIEDGRKVSVLKEAIKSRSDGLITVPWPRLQLFLAKKKTGDVDEWLQGTELAAVALDEARKVPGMLDERKKRQNFVWMDPTLYVNNDKHFGKEFTPGEGRVHVLVVVPTGAETSSPFAELAAKLVQHTFLKALSTTHSSSQELEKQLVKEYACDRGSNQNSESMLLCLAMDVGLPSSVVIASHIFRRDNDDLKSLVQVDDIDDVRNGLLLFRAIKSAIDDLDNSFLVDTRDQFILKVFNPTIKGDLLVTH
jgi:hypothetical protein